MAGRIEDYALIGDLQTAALVGRDGAIDWLCLPRLDSEAVLARLLGTPGNGFWRIGPSVFGVGPSPAADRRSYRGDSLIMEHEWDTPTGTLRVTDFMLPRTDDDDTPRLVRIAEALTGTVTVDATLSLRFDYGKVVPWVHKIEDNRTCAVAGPDAVWLDTDAETHGESLTTRSRVTLTKGERATFTLSWRPSFKSPPAMLDIDQALEDTEKFWADWVSQCTYDGRYRAAVIRSLITLKALTNPLTGGIAAAATTSLPEEIGGVRNWDYRHVWIRDAAKALWSLLRAGYLDEARAWRKWLLRAVAGDPENLQIMYGIAGEREMPEITLDWLVGYEESGPVRIGNAAADQRQLDVYGEVIGTLHLAAQFGLERDETSNALLTKLVQSVEAHWRDPDAGIWEVRGPSQHFVHSKVMAWVAVDRAIKLVEEGHAEGPIEQWRQLRDTIHQDVCTRGYDPERNTFTQFYGSQELDAALLLIPQVGFLPADDPRVIGTIEAVQKELSTPDGFLLRYPTHGDDVGTDGLPGDEGAFLVCAFWLVMDLAMIGRHDDARALFERLLSLSNDVGLLAEEWDSHLQRQLGNFPQAFSHIGIVGGALELELADLRASLFALPGTSR
ncbi:glycoside hydrolase family 15 protein [Streptomyces tropicalis]|uniref:Glycoside hydrolase family 15 protein n=1 Tax=Streptomyces tropicalis TaxID=3034234 RepID=A0ABT6AF49_9ACTN|nr:glycoside hydrolase family 15 protein [Streptomyces tropicalis]MDF3303272.1 glycoside hydrolase family 15 protein [Streptomyces tropicalis]